MQLKSFPHNDSFFINANIANWTIGKILVDNASSADIMFASTFDRMELNRNLVQPPDTLLYGFGGKVIHTLGKISLPVSSDTIQYYPYFGIFGRGHLNKFEAVIHQSYLCMKMPACKVSSQFLVIRVMGEI
jgi:hypothetical protein